MTQQIYGDVVAAKRPERPLADAVKNGLRSRCPRCGEGHLFRAFVKPVDRCEVCGEDLSHQRADDMPAYLDIVVVGHIVVGAFVAVESITTWPIWAHMALWTPLTLALAILFLQPIKGAVIAMQWALYMHGFGGEADPLQRPSLGSPGTAA
jgi:uncharacterized protein (DUF983 family)